MKRMHLLFVLFLTAFWCTLTASAAGYAVKSVDIDGNAVKISVTAESDCALFVGVYDQDGRLLSVQARDVSATAGTDISVSVSDGIPAGSFAKTFLTNTDNNKPLCKSFSTQDSNVYAILYADGTMVFQYGDTPQSGQKVKNIYAVDMTGAYTLNNPPPWHDEYSSIEQVEFNNTISPQSTAYWFSWCSNLKEIRNLNKLDTSNVTNMSNMFYACSSLKALDLSAFQTDKVTSMSEMFSVCPNLTTLDLSAFNTSNVKAMSDMFRGCSSLTTLDLSNFNTANLSSMSYMFFGCQSLVTIYVSEQFITEQIMLGQGRIVFYNCTSLIGEHGTTYDESHIDYPYARIDGGAENPGYFTAKT